MYSFPILNTKLGFYHIFAYGILLLNIIAMLMLRQHSKNILAEIVIMFFVFTAMALWDFRNFKKNRLMLPVGILLIAFSFFWLRVGANWAFIANIALWALYTISKRKMMITVSSENIVYPSFPKKTFLWDDLNNVILKDDMLTIDCKNNKVYQHFIPHSERYANEEKFNAFCRKQFLKNS